MKRTKLFQLKGKKRSDHRKALAAAVAQKVKAGDKDFVAMASIVRKLK